MCAPKSYCDPGGATLLFFSTAKKMISLLGSVLASLASSNMSGTLSVVCTGIVCNLQIYQALAYDSFPPSRSSYQVHNAKHSDHSSLPYIVRGG